MDGEIDLETYTLSIIRLNSAFEKLENNEPISDIKEMFHESYSDLDKLYHEIVEDLNQEEVNINEYYLFFQTESRYFPNILKFLKALTMKNLTAKSLLL